MQSSTVVGSPGGGQAWPLGLRASPRRLELGGFNSQADAQILSTCAQDHAQPEMRRRKVGWMPAQTGGGRIQNNTPLPAVEF